MSTLYVNNINAATGSLVTFGGGAAVTGDLLVTGTLNAKVTDFVVSANSTTLGDAASDTVTINARDIAVPNNIRFNENTLHISASARTVGIGIEPQFGPSATKLHVLSTGSQQQWSYDPASYAKMTVADASHTTLATGESGNLTLDAAGNIILDADGGSLIFKDGTSGDAGTIGTIYNDSTRLHISASQAGAGLMFSAGPSNQDIVFKGNDAGTAITALTLDMSEAGAAIFNDKVTAASAEINGHLDVDGKVTVDAGASAGAASVAVTHTDVDEHAVSISTTNILRPANLISLDHNDSATSAVNPISMYLDFDKTGVTAADVGSAYTGSFMHMYDAATNHADAVVTMTGQQIYVNSANAQGTLTNIGLSVAAEGADANYAALFNSGYVGIGDSAPGRTLSVFGAHLSGAVASFSNNAPGGNNQSYHGIMIAGGANDGSGTTYYVTCYDGDYDGGSGANTPIGYIANTNGTFALTDPSDERLKDNIRDVSFSGLEIVEDIRVRDFELKKNGITKTGFIAQELEEVYPPAVVEPDGHMTTMMGVANTQLIPVLVKAVQELTEKVKSLEDQLSKK